ncbi:RNA polymerase sigma factor [Cystobacter fuscus]|uniref:RNA polymerase sigma factor n=1 Tax=Cystobacter fuscus TaxID=43 RepID=UPI0037C05392
MLSTQWHTGSLDSVDFTTSRPSWSWPGNLPFLEPFLPTSPSHKQFWEIWQSYQHPLHQQSLRLTRGNQDEARELLSAAMLRAAQKFPQHSKNIKNMKAWLHQLLHNICMDAMKERRHIVPKPLDSDEEWEEEFPSHEEQSSPEELFMRHESVRGMWQQVQELPETLRAPLVMRFCEDLSYPEIAARLTLTHCNTRKRIQLACERMRRTLVEEP